MRRAGGSSPVPEVVAHEMLGCTLFRKVCWPYSFGQCTFVREAFCLVSRQPWITAHIELRPSLLLHDSFMHGQVTYSFSQRTDPDTDSHVPTKFKIAAKVMIYLIAMLCSNNIAYLIKDA